jgi:hypothetical protein
MALLLLLCPLSNICSDSPQPSTALSKLTCCLKSAFSCGYVTFKTVEEAGTIVGLACFFCCKVGCGRVCGKK